jgi:hypothetical protein
MAYYNYSEQPYAEYAARGAVAGAYEGHVLRDVAVFGGTGFLAHRWRREGVLRGLEPWQRTMFGQLERNAANVNELVNQTTRVYGRVRQDVGFPARTAGWRTRTGPGGEALRVRSYRPTPPVTTRTFARRYASKMSNAAIKMQVGRIAAGAFTLMNVAFFAPLVYSGLKHMTKAANSFIQNTYEPNFGGNYLDTAAASTERQRAIQAIQKSHLNARAAIGNEAQLMHRTY